MVTSFKKGILRALRKKGTSTKNIGGGGGGGGGLTTPLPSLLWRACTDYFLWFAYWAPKEWKTGTELFCLSILTIYLNDWSTFWYVYCCHFYLFPARFLNKCKPRTMLYFLWRAAPPELAFYGSGLVYLPSWLGMVNTSWLDSMRSKNFCKWNLSFFKTILPNKLFLYLGIPLQITSSLLSHFCLFQNAILHKMLG